MGNENSTHGDRGEDESTDVMEQQQQQRTSKRRRLFADDDELRARFASLGRQSILQGIQNHSVLFSVLPEELRDDAEIALAAIKAYVLDGRAVSPRLKNDRDFVLEAVKANGEFLEYVSDALRDDREIVLEAVRQRGLALKYASQRLRADREVVLVAVRQDSLAFWSASEGLRGDREVVVTCIDNMAAENVNVLTFSNLHNDPKVEGALLRKGGDLGPTCETVNRLANLIPAVQALPHAFVIGVDDEESIIQFSSRWEHSVWHKIWVTLSLEPPGMPGVGRFWVELSGLSLELRQAQELRHCAPVIGAALSLSRDWTDLDIYTYRYPQPRTGQ